MNSEPSLQTARDADYAEWRSAMLKWQKEVEQHVSLRDTFAAAALTGLLSRTQWMPDECVPEAYRIADAMLRERLRNGSVEGRETVQSDNIPDAGKMAETSGEVDAYRRFVGEVMNWISEATSFLHDDVLRTDDARDVITNACSQCWDAFDRIAYPSTNHDAAPAARAMQSRDCSGLRSGTGDTPVTEPMPVFVAGSGSVTPVPYGRTDEKRVFYDTIGGQSDRPKPIAAPAKTNPKPPRNGTPAEGTVRDEGSVPSSRTENATVAWAVVYDRSGEIDCELIYPDKNIAADVALEGAGEIEGRRGVGKVVPLYRSPTLTDEERIAIGRLMRDYQSAGFAVDASVAATLRKLLQRLGGER